MDYYNLLDKYLINIMETLLTKRFYKINEKTGKQSLFYKYFFKHLRPRLNHRVQVDITSIACLSYVQVIITAFLNKLTSYSPDTGFFHDVFISLPFAEPERDIASAIF